MASRSPIVKVGAALRAAREERGLSLAKVAELTGISKSALSLIETDRSDVPLSRLVALADVYGLHLTELVGERGAANPVVVRRTERAHLHSPAESRDIYLLSTDRTRRMMPVIAVYAPGGGMAGFTSHDGEEFVLVLEGKMRLELEGEDPVDLSRGDCAYYDSRREHRWANAGTGIARVISVGTPPHF